DGDQRVAIFAGEGGDARGQLARREVPVKLGALQAGVGVDDLSAGVVTFGAAAGGIDGEDVGGGIGMLAWRVQPLRFASRRAGARPGPSLAQNRRSLGMTNLF